MVRQTSPCRQSLSTGGGWVKMPSMLTLGAARDAGGMVEPLPELSTAELETLHAQLQQADLATQAEQGVACCYARSNKYWVTDPTGIAWETFHSLGSVPTFGEEPDAAACCTPEPAAVPAKIAVVAKACCA